jgi:MFS family permease
MTAPHAPSSTGTTTTTTEGVTMSTATPAEHQMPADTQQHHEHADGDTGPRKSWALLGVALAAQILVVLDISVVNTALPSIGRSLDLGGSQLQWLVTAYLMMSGGGLLLGGRVADLLSRRTVFLTGLALFTVASLLSGFAETGGQLIATRSIQGLSAALLTPSALSLIMTTYAGAQRKAALALWGAVGSLGVAAGVLLGGAITTWTSWQFIFWINAPIGLIAFAVGRKVIVKDTTPRPTLSAFDLPGAAAVIGGLASLIYGLGGTADHGWWSIHTATAFAVSIALLGIFLKLEQRAARPLFPPNVW